MKRKTTRDQPDWIAYDALTDIDSERLKLVGAVALEYNCAEDLLDFVMTTAAQLDFRVAPQILSRINGIDGKCAIIKFVTANSLVLEGEPATLIGNAVDHFSLCKTLRDAVIHARVDDPAADVVMTISKRGERYEVDLSTKALKSLLDHLDAASKDFAAIYQLLSYNILPQDYSTPEERDPSSIIALPAFQAALAQVRERQIGRLSLPAIPSLPQERLERQTSKAPLTGNS